ncbi:MAG: arylesterase [Rhodomicrobium sp.]
MQVSHRLNAAPQRLIWTWLLAFATAAVVFSASRQGYAEEKAPAKDGEVVILAFGDSLTAGYMIPPDKSFPAQLQAALRAKGYAVRILNSGVSGDTAEEGLDRLDWSLVEKVDGAIVEFGANDALRGLDPKVTERALDAMLKSLSGKRIELLLAGMEAPRNWGEAYDKAFRNIYPRLSQKYGAIFYPFFLRDVATIARLNLADGLHPTPEGVAIIVNNILPDVEMLIARIRENRATKHS